MITATHSPTVHGLHLATDPAVSDAWTAFFIEARRLAALARQRRTAQQAETPTDTIPTQPSVEPQH